MNPEKDGGPAFPRTGIGNAGVQYDAPSQDGMSLRDWFAGQVLCGMIGKERAEPFTTPTQAKAHLKSIAAGCYAMADAMLEARTP